MKTILLLSAVLLAAGTFLFINQNNTHDSLYNSELFGNFEQWSTKYQRTYTSEQEKLYRFQIYQEMSQYIKEENIKQGYEFLEVNQFAALTDEEFGEYYLIKKDDYERRIPVAEATASYTDVPETFDWTTQGAVPPATDAKYCTASYAIASADAVSGLYWQKSQKLIPLSAQQIISCTTTYNGGCKGGSDILSYIYLIQNGAQSAESYPFKGNTGSCDYSEDDVVYTPQNAYFIKRDDVETMQYQVTQQPLTAWIDASKKTFRYYRGGDRPYNENCFSQDGDNGVNYVMELVGYNNTAKYPYWIAQASFGTKWGNDGQMYVRKYSKGSGVCDFQTRVRFPAATK